MTFDEFAKVNGLSFFQLPSGSWRVKVGKKLTRGAVVVKTGTEDFVRKVAREYVQEAARNRDNSIYISDIERGQAIEALNLLKNHDVHLSLLEVARAFCERLPKTKGITVQFACDKYLDLVEDRRQKRGSTSTYGRLLKRHFASFSHLYGDRELYEISADEIREWLDVQCFGKSAKTHNNYLKGVRAMFSMAMKRKWVVENVSLEVDFMPVMPSAVGVFAPDVVGKLLQAAYDAKEMDILLAFAIQSFGGLRRSEVLGLSWGDVGATSIRVTASNSKTDKGRGVEIQPPLQKILSLFDQWKNKKNRDSPLIEMKDSQWDKKRKKIMLAAKIPNWPHNALRHTFVSSRLAMTKDPVTTAYEAGHTIEVMKSHYDAVVDPADGKKHFQIKLKTISK